MTEGSPPTGRWSRLWRLAEVGARAGSAMLRDRGAEVAARRAVEVLGDLRGLAAKVGQMASYVDGFVPESQRHLYQSTLSRLQSAAPSSAPAQIRARVESELGAPIERLFQQWQELPFASASIGQVHRAVLHDGREVAVKVQHPGIDQAVQSDLDNVGLVEGLVSSVGPRGLNARAVYEELRARFLEELDYRLEAEQLRFFRAFHACDPSVRIPDVIGTHSSERVLTTEFVGGWTLDEAAAQPVERRRRYAEVLWRFVFRGNLLGGRFNADPHPGNYVFHPDGTVSFLDFGCVQVLDSEHRQRAVAVHHAALASDEAGFRQAVAVLLGTRGGSYERAALDYSRRCFEPIFRRPFIMDRAYVRGLTEQVQTLKHEIFAKDGSFVPLPPNMVLLNRLQFGFYSVLARLQVAVDYAAVERSFLQTA